MYDIQKLIGSAGTRGQECASQQDDVEDPKAKRHVLPGGLERFSFSTWNSNGLMGVDTLKAAKIGIPSQAYEQL